jgi:hypothetical protein
MSLCFIKHHAMGTYGRGGGIASLFLSLALDRGEWSASCPGCFTPRERAPITLWIGGWVGHKVSLDAVMMKFAKLNHFCY